MSYDGLQISYKVNVFLDTRNISISETYQRPDGDLIFSDFYDARDRVLDLFRGWEKEMCEKRFKASHNLRIERMNLSSNRTIY